ncbi:MAG: sensor domain-containing diguanylate cyclase [Alphaproteobacteria bacterium]|nr:sensor domain-containing diguanylate cyclase [Alphaproteobacteria bacterium]
MDLPSISKKIIPMFAASLSMIIGALVIWGWHTNNVTLIQVQPQFAGMQYNSALCFIAAAIGIIGICKNWRLLPFLMGIFIMGVSYLTLIEYVFQINLGIDELFMHVAPGAQNSMPGRMSPNGALILSLMGTSIFILSNYVRSRLEIRSLLFILMVLTLIPLAMSFVGIFGYIVDMPATYGWGSYTRMAIHNTITNILLCIALISIICIKASEANFSFLSWVPLLVFVVIEVITLSFWEASLAYIEKNKHQRNTLAAQSVKNVIREELEYRTESLSRMAKRWESRKGGTPYQEWSQDALNSIADQPGYEAIEWVDAEYFVKWIAPLRGNEAALGLNLLDGKKRSRHLETLRQDGKTIITPMLTLTSGENGFLIYTPVGRGENFQGIIVGVVNAKAFFEEVFREAITDYNIAIYYHNGIVYQRHPDLGYPTDNNSITYEVTDYEWSITSWPVPALVAKQQSWLPYVILIIGFIVATMLALIAHLAQIAHRNALQAAAEIKTRRKTEQQLILYSKKLKKLSLLDSLTGINNRRSLTAILQTEMTQIKKGQKYLSIILLDIDFFKKINDTYGHVTGDTVLQKVGSILKKNTRSVDTVARYGGEEFCIVLNNATDREAYEVAEKLRHLLAQQIFHSEKQHTFQITCSFGVYQVPSNTKKITQVFEIVDGALYTAKNSGRNCVVLV